LTLIPSIKAGNPTTKQIAASVTAVNDEYDPLNPNDYDTCKAEMREKRRFEREQQTRKEEESGSDSDVDGDPL
jgi:hypothetical protein